MDVYVAAKWEEKARARKFMDVVESLGNRITCDWTKEPDPETKPEHERGMYLHACGMDALNGALGAQVLVLLGHPKVRGALVEFGVALGRGATILVVEREKCENIFFNCDGVLHVTEQEAIAFIEKMTETDNKHRRPAVADR
jgi:hypothetical protein